MIASPEEANFCPLCGKKPRFTGFLAEPKNNS